MTVFNLEIKRCFKAFLIWTLAITFMLVVCVLIFPEMKDQMAKVSDAFSDMGSFSTAFGMDQISFSELINYYGIECGNVLGIGGAFFAALLGVSVLAKEEKEHTSEFLFTHPWSRARVVTEKLLSIVFQIILMNVIIVLSAVLSFLAISESVNVSEFALIHISYLIMQLEIAFICFGISAFIKRGSIGIGIGLAAVLYFLNIIANITESAEFIKYITPFAYANPSSIITNNALDYKYIIIGTVYAVLMVVIGYIKYTKKDLVA